MYLKKIFYIFSTLLVVSLFIFFNIGHYLDITQEPHKSDIIVCLGGGEKQTRIKKSLELYEKAYAKTKTLLITGGTAFTRVDNMQDDRMVFVHDKNSTATIKYNPMTRNTAEEMLYIKDYMLKHFLKDVIIVSGPPHSRRIQMFSKIFNFKESGLQVHIVSSHPVWWDKSAYYKSSLARQLVFIELLKIPYNYLKYTLLDKIGLLNTLNRLEDTLKGKKNA